MKIRVFQLARELDIDPIQLHELAVVRAAPQLGPRRVGVVRRSSH